MNTPLPYSFTYYENKYIFQTDNSVAYSVEFTDGTHYFFNLPRHIPVYEFNIKVLNAADSIGQPYDKRIEITIVDILTAFFENHKNSLIYVCDNLDNRQQSRYRKFERWFKKSKTVLIEKYDIDFSVYDIQILASLIVHTQNPDKDLLIRLFFDIYK
jgi:hypothetical protein